MKRKPKEVDDEEIDSDELPDQPDVSDRSTEPEDFFTETPEEKKLRLTKDYLAQLDGKLGDRDAVSVKLQNDYLEESNEGFSDIAILPPTDQVRFRAHHRGRPTAIAIGENVVFSGAKDGSIFCVNIPMHRKFPIGQHSSAIFSMALDRPHSQLATGDGLGVVSIWNSEAGGLSQELKGHRSTVSGLAFQASPNQLFSASFDATIRVWDCETGACMQILFGHEMEVTALDFCGFVVSSGTDRTLRLWKYEEDKQFIFHGGHVQASIDCVSLFNNRFCVSGSQDGRLCLWDLTRKRPLTVVKEAHGPCNWISAVATLRYRRLFASGSCDGKVRLWNVADGRIVPLFEIPIDGYVADLGFADDGSFLAVQISQEPRFGRWLPPIRSARAGVHVIKIEKSSS
jgi:ribosomal RNA-processing protein 9